ncbi:MAG: STELLO glycosyltransferase family protein [Tannerellaceae bacterium]|jgi:hypothetical protein|nr:STELLO glycosyltransferase family protein [Tannerellaceae bacterium]
MSTQGAQRTTLVITSIADSTNKALRDYARLTAEHGFGFVVAGDEKSPANFHIEGCDFLSIEQQKRTGFALAEILPVRHYARKNIAYLVAMKSGSEVIVETDDDNFPRPDFWLPRPAKIKSRLYENCGWLNAYSLFTKAMIWPRGFDLEHIRSNNSEKFQEGEWYCPIQQGLADENPDVDAIYRMTCELPLTFDESGPIAIGSGAWCPFNSQNTTWLKEAFMLMYLPSYCSFRMTDIWRSFVAQRICWENGMRVLFHKATVWQERNAHNFLTDFKDEIPGYINNGVIAERLEALQLRRGLDNIGSNLLACYQVFIDLNLMSDKEIPLIEAWIEDVLSVIK